MDIDPNKLKIGYIILFEGKGWIAEKIKKHTGSKWTHVAGSLGGYDIIEAVSPRSRVFDIRKKIEDAISFKILRFKPFNYKRYKIAIWWATLCNITYDWPNVILWRIKWFFPKTRAVKCSELIYDGFLKENVFVFDTPYEKVVPGDFDDPELFDEVTDIWMDD